MKPISQFPAGPINEPLLEHLDDIPTPPGCGHFFARESFMAAKDFGDVSFLDVSDPDFVSGFMDKNEEHQPETVLHRSRLLHACGDSKIIGTLERQMRVKVLTSFSTIFYLTVTERGARLATNEANIFYVENVGRKLCLVGAVWQKGILHLFASSISATRFWLPGGRVYYPD